MPTIAYPRFPLALSAGAIVTTSLALAAAALDIQWSAAPRAGAALHFAWLYVNIMLALTWLVIWPAFTFSTLRLPFPPERIRRELLWDFSAIAVAAIPALAIGAFLSATPPRELLSTLALQAAFGIFSLGILTFAQPRRPLHASAAGLLAAVALAAPVAAYLYAEFLPLAPKAWFAFIPELALARTSQSPGLITFITALAYAIAGLSLLAAPTAARDSSPIP